MRRTYEHIRFHLLTYLCGATCSLGSAPFSLPLVVLVEEEEEEEHCVPVSAVLFSHASVLTPELYEQ